MRKGFPGAAGARGERAKGISQLSALRQVRSRCGAKCNVLERLADPGSVEYNGRFFVDFPEGRAGPAGVAQGGLDVNGNSRVRRRGGRSGFTLLELMMGITVLLVAVLGAMATHVTALNLVRTTRESNTAITDLQAAMEQVLLLVPDDIPIATSLYADNQAIAAFTNLHLTNQRITCDYPGYVPGTIPDPLPIVLTCTWSDWRNRPRQMVLSSMKTR